jgi:hypothetical protein
MAEEGSLHLSAGSAASASAGGSSACAIASCRARWEDVDGGHLEAAEASL